MSFAFKVLSISNIIYYSSLSIRLTSLSITCPRTIHVVTNGRASFFLTAKQYSCVCVCVCVCVWDIFFTHLSTDRHLGCPYILAIVNIVAVTMECKYLFDVLSLLPLDTHPEVGLWDHVACLFLIFWGITKPFCIVTLSIHIATNSARGCAFLFSLANNSHLLLFW